jgi:hypothetical protein
MRTDDGVSAITTNCRVWRGATADEIRRRTADSLGSITRSPGDAEAESSSELARAYETLSDSGGEPAGD